MKPYLLDMSPINVLSFAVKKSKEKETGHIFVKGRNSTGCAEQKNNRVCVLGVCAVLLYNK